MSLVGGVIELPRYLNFSATFSIFTGGTERRDRTTENGTERSDRKTGTERWDRSSWPEGLGQNVSGPQFPQKPRTIVKP